MLCYDLRLKDGYGLNIESILEVKMKSDARLLLNKKKWIKGPGISKPDWTSRGTVDARKILNLKRSQKSKPPVLGSFMRTKTATSLVASQIQKEITPITKPPDKLIKLSKDGNIIITSKSKKHPQILERDTMALPNRKIGASSRSTVLEENLMQIEPSTSDMDDLEHTAVGDVLDFDSLPSAFVATKPFQNLSRKSALNQILEKRHTMVADELSENKALSGAKVYVSNLHPTVSKQDVMELFGNVGLIRNIEMVRPGTAVIDFYDVNDAEKACDLYHNRLLDGLPMKCYLQNGAEQQRCTISQRLGERMVTRAAPVGSGSLPLVPTNPRSRYNPRNVQFTVKLS